MAIGLMIHVLYRRRKPSGEGETPSLHILDNGVDDFRRGVWRTRIHAGLDFIAAAREAFGHWNIVRDGLRQFDDKRVFVLAGRLDGLRNAVERFARNRHEGQLVAEFNGCDAARMGWRALFAAVVDTLRELTEGRGNLIGKVLAFEIAFLRNVGHGCERVFGFG